MYKISSRILTLGVIYAHVDLNCPDRVVLASLVEAQSSDGTGRQRGLLRGRIAGNGGSLPVQYSDSEIDRRWELRVGDEFGRVYDSGRRIHFGEEFNPEFVTGTHLTGETDTRQGQADTEACPTWGMRAFANRFPESLGRASPAIMPPFRTRETEVETE